MRSILYTLFFICLSSFAFAQADTSTLRVDETSGPWTDTVDEDARPYAYDVQSDIVFKGPTALRFELRDGDCFTAFPEDPERGWDDCTRDRERAEVRERWNAPVDQEMWYSIMLYIPEDYTPMYPKQMFWQWHNGIWGPNMFFHLNENKFHIDILTEEGQTTTQYTFGTDVLTLGQWHELIVNVVWSGDDNRGFMDLFVNNELLVSHRAATLDPQTYASGVGPYVKYGIYRSHLFRYELEGPHPTHVLYFDEYRRGRNLSDVDAFRYDGD